MNLKPVHIIIALVLAAFAWLFWGAEWIEKEVDVGPSEEIMRQPYFAALKFANKTGKPAHYQESLNKLDRLLEQDIKRSDTIMLINANSAMTAEQANQVLDFVARGGRLIHAASNQYLSISDTQYDMIFDELAIEIEPIYEDAKGSTWLNLLWQLTNACPVDKGLTEQHQPSNQEVTVYFPYQHRILTGASTDVKWQLDNRIAAVEYGQGIVYLVSSNKGWTNNLFRCGDNAFLLWNMIEDDQSLWIIENKDAPSLMSMLYDKAPLFVIAICLFIALIIWQKTSRFGPIDNQIEINRRELKQHLKASSLYIWQADNGETLLSQLIKDIHHQMNLLQPQYSKLEQPQQIDLIVTMSGMKKTDVQTALIPTEKTNEAVFQHRVILCQNLLHHLTDARSQ